MVSNKVIIDSLLRLRDLHPRFADVWRSDEDVARSLSVMGVAISEGDLNGVMSRDNRIKDSVDQQDIAGNMRRVWRRQCQIVDNHGAARAKAKFYYLGNEQDSNFPSEREEWQNVCNSNRFRVARVDGLPPGNTTEERKELDEQQQHQGRERRCTRPATPRNDSIAATIMNANVTWTHKNTRSLFGVADGDARSVLESHAEKLGRALSSIQPIDAALTLPHNDAKDVVTNPTQAFRGERQ